MLRPTRLPGVVITAGWIALAAVCGLIAALLQPALADRFLPPQAAAFRDTLHAGITVLRILLAATAGCALLTLLLRPAWRDLDWTSTALPLDPTDWWFAIALFAAAFLVRFPNSGQSFDWDELSTLVRIVKRGIPVIVAFSAEGNNHLFNSIAGWLAWKIGGETEFVLRIPSLLFGSLTAPAVYLLTLRLTPRPVALALAALLILHFPAAFYSTELRGYSGAAFFCALSICLFARFRAAPAVSTALAYTAAAFAANGFQLLAVFLPIGHGIIALIWWLRSGRNAQSPALTALLACAWAGLFGLIANALLLPGVAAYASGGQVFQALRPMSIPFLVTRVLPYAAGVQTLAQSSALIWIAAAALWICALCGLWRLKTPLATIAISGFLCHTAIALALKSGTGERMFFDAWLPFCLGLAAWLGTKRPTFAIPVVLLAALVWTPAYLRWYRLGNPPLKQIARTAPKPVALAGLQSDMNVHYFPGAAVLPDRQALASAIQQPTPPTTIVAGFNCGRPGYPELANSQYRLARQLERSEADMCYEIWVHQ